MNEKRVRQKLPEILADGNLNIRSNLYKYQSNRRKLDRMEKRNTGFFRHCLRKVVQALEEFEDAMEKCDIKIE